MITKYIKGDLTKTDLKYIAHSVNCQNVMGSGVAKAIYTAYPEVKELYRQYAHQYQHSEYNKRELLGEVQGVKSKDKVIFNLFTQLNYGPGDKRYVNYKALVDCFSHLTERLKGEIIAIPKLSSDLAGGKWEFIEQLINDVTENNLEVWVYEI